MMCGVVVDDDDDSDHCDNNSNKCKILNKMLPKFCKTDLTRFTN